MSTEIDSIPATIYPMANYNDPDRYVSIKMKASEVWKLRKIVACLSNPSSLTYDVILSVADNATHSDMDHLHRVLYFGEMGWDFMTKEEAARILGEK
tara:strand:- start:1550 stop:1840 length:291 start_codon:yes stop_codon:yes gene_type:complete